MSDTARSSSLISNRRVSFAFAPLGKRLVKFWVRTIRFRRMFPTNISRGAPMLIGYTVSVFPLRVRHVYGAGNGVGVRSATGTSFIGASSCCIWDRMIKSPGGRFLRWATGSRQLSASMHGWKCERKRAWQPSRAEVGIQSMISCTGCSLRHCSGVMHSQLKSTARQWSAMPRRSMWTSDAHRGAPVAMASVLAAAADVFGASFGCP